MSVYHDYVFDEKALCVTSELLTHLVIIMIMNRGGEIVAIKTKVRPLDECN